MANSSEIFVRIVDILADEFECPREKLVPEARLFEDLDLDSIDAVDLVVRLKNETGLKIGADDFKTIRTLGDVAEAIRHLAETGTAA